MINLSTERLKKILTTAGIIDEKMFNTIVDEAIRRKQNPIDIIISRGIINEDYFYLLLAKAFNVERVDLGTTVIDEQVLQVISEDIARSRRVVIFGRNQDGSYNVAMENPTDLETTNFLTLRLGAPVRPFLVSDDDLNRGYTLYGQKQAQDFKQLIEQSIKESLRSKARGAEEAAKDVPIVALVDNLLAYAISSRASDVHFEILDDAVLIRFRIDGILHEILRMSPQVHSSVIARLKILSGLRIDEHTKPQDGRFRYKVGGKLIDIRVSIIPTFYGEKVELRLLDAAQKPLALEELGMFENTAKRIRDAIGKSYGMVLMCGPTGSGKTTTLYSIMNILNRPEVNIVTIENPIEYDMRYVNQIQVNEIAGITFSNGLRSILRQDPNIIMVGEIRDSDTAGISVQAALTGHLVLSSLHTNDAPTAIPRLMDMGIQPFLVSAVLNAISSQRLVRHVHVDCIESYTPEKAVYETINEQLMELDVDPKAVKLPKTFYRGKGCDACNHTGYVGRIGIFEVMEVTESIRQLIISPNFNLDTLQHLARKEGMVSMFEDGLRKVELGMTTVDELFRVVRE